MSTSGPISKAEAEALPLFPLKQVVFFPGTTVPLHIFEPRFKAMLMHCVENGPQAMILAQVDEASSASTGQSAVLSVAGAGRIEHWEQLPNGNFAVVLEGVSRVRILHEVPSEDRPFRIAQAEVLEDGTYRERDEPSCAQARQVLLSCASQIVSLIQREHPDFTLEIEPTAPGGAVADLVADRLLGDPQLRQAVLETLDPLARLSLVTEHAGELLALLSRRRFSSSEPPPN